MPNYYNIEKLIVDGDNVNIIYKDIEFNHDHSKPAVYVFDYLVYSNSYELAKMAFRDGYKPYTYNRINEYDQVEVGNSINDFFTKEDIDDLMILAKQSKRDMFDYNLSMDELKYNHSLYKPLEDIPNFEPMLDLLLEYNVSGQPSKELMKREYENCYKIYILSIIGAIDIDDKGNYFLKYNSMSRNVYQKYCSKDYANFKNIKDYIKFKNDLRLTDKLEDILFSTQKNRVIFVNKNQTDYIIEPYKQLSSDELKEIYEYYYYKGGREKIQEIYIF